MTLSTAWRWRRAAVAGGWLTVALGACAGPAPDAETPGDPVAPAGAVLAVAAASDLRFALDELLEAFHAEHRDVRVETTYGSSGNFFAQIANGAPFDLFLSADIEYPRQLAARGLVVAGTEFLYAHGRLAVWVRRDSPIAVEQAGLAALADSRVRRVAIANPEHAPYGRAAEAALARAGLLERVRPRLVLGENISQTLQFVQSGSADVGIVALSLALAPRVAGEGRHWVVPPDAHPVLEQGGVILAASRQQPAAQAFRAFVLGSQGRAVLERYGFMLPPPAAVAGAPE